MELPDFDTLKHWALAEPERLDALLHQQIEALIAQVGPDRQRRLRGLQFRIDCQRRLARNNLDSCIRIANIRGINNLLATTLLRYFQYFLQRKPPNVNKQGGLFFICCEFTLHTHLITWRPAKSADMDEGI